MTPPAEDKGGAGRWAFALVLWVYLAALLAYRFSEFPGLHGDEAWLGLFSLRILDRGLYTPHEMNTYTGSLYAWFLSGVFSLARPDVFFLRLPSVALNAAAALVGAVHFGRRFGSRGALAWLLLLAGSALFVLKSRLGWEITALQNLLMAGLLVSLARIADRGPSAPRTLFAFILIYVGVINHFIFLSIPASLVLASLLQLVVLRDEKALPFFRFSLLALALSAAVFVLKPRITDAAWASHRSLYLGIAAALPVLFTAACSLGAAFEPLARRLLERHLGSDRAAFALKRLAAFGIVLFCVFHLKALVQIWSGVALLERFASWAPPLPLQVALYAGAASLLTVFAAHAHRSLQPAAYATLDRYERLLCLWPVAYLAVFVLFRNINSIRYYLLPSFLMYASLAVALAQTNWKRRPKLLLACLSLIVGLNVCLWREIRRPVERRPISFRIGWHRERSWDYLPKTSLQRELARLGICDFQDYSSFIDLPLLFYLKGHPPDRCDRSKVLATSYCLDCAGPPYFSWSVKPAPGVRPPSDPQK
ncbi:MAG: hypothetical protein HY078_04950 [Elusimicrobia bacterium]|nr:hypothetical protein [Elusimicrobiota bacterium]